MQKIFVNIPIYWINLESSIERRKHMEENFNSTINYRIDAIDGRNQEYFTKNYNVINPKPEFSTALIAVLCSHFKAIKTAYDKKLEHVIIIEDSCAFDETKISHTILDIINLASTKDPNYEAVQLFTSSTIWEHSNPFLLDYQKNGLTVYKKNEYLGGLFYLINRKGMKKILEVVPTNGIEFFDFTNISNISGMESMIYDNLNTYILNYPMFYIYTYKVTFPFYYSTKELNDWFSKYTSNNRLAYHE